MEQAAEWQTELKSRPSTHGGFRAEEALASSCRLLPSKAVARRPRRCSRWQHVPSQSEVVLTMSRSMYWLAWPSRPAW